MQVISVDQSSSADFTQRVALGGQLVDLRLTWNSRSEQWYLLLTTSEGAVFGSIKLVCDWPLLHQYLGQTDFRGDFIVLRADTKAEGYLTYDNLGTGWTLNYLTAAESASWRIANGLE